MAQQHETDISERLTKRAKLSTSSDPMEVQVLMSLLSNSVMNNKARLT